MAKKTYSWIRFLPIWPKFGSIFFFFFPKNLAPSLTRNHGQLSSCAISEKTNDPNLRKLSDRRTDGQTNKSDFIGRCPTNVEHRKIKIGKVYIFTFKVLKLVAPM